MDFREFMCGLSITSTASKKDQLKWAFEMYDIDGSGLISLDECITVIKVTVNFLISKLLTQNYVLCAFALLSIFYIPISFTCTESSAS